MNFKKRLISLLIAVLLVFNSIPIGHAVLGNLSIVGADTVGVENALKEAVTDMTYGWDGRTYRFPSSILATVEAGHEVYLLADTQVDGLDEENEIPKVGEKAVNVTFTNIRLAGNDADQYIISELEELVSFSKEIKILPKTLKISPAMTQAFYGQDLPSRGRVSVNENYKDQLVRKEDRVEVSCTFTFDFDGAVQEGSYPLKEVSDIQLKGPDSGNYKAEVENQDDLVFVIAPYETDAVAEDPDAAVSDNGEGYIHNGKQEAHLVAPENFLISTTGALDGEWVESVTVDLEETEAGAFKEITYYLRNNDRESTEYKAVCQKTYSYSAMPMPTVIGIELVELEMQNVVEDATITYKPMVRDKDDAVYANGDMQVVVYVTGASYEQETEIILSVNGVETVKPADEVILEDGRYTYKAAFDISSVDGESIIYELKAYARNSSGTGEIYPAENCRDTYIGLKTSVTKPLVLDRKGPTVNITEINVVYLRGYIAGDFTVSDDHVGIVKVEYAWDSASYKNFTGYHSNQTDYTSYLYFWESEMVKGGLHTLHLRVTDELGNITLISQKDTNGVDSLAPAILSVEIHDADGNLIPGTENGVFANGPVTIVVRARDMADDVNAITNLGEDSVKILVGKDTYKMNRASVSEDNVEHVYTLTIDPNKTDVKWENIRIQVIDNAGNAIDMALTETTHADGAGKYLSNNLYVENEKPSINISKLGEAYGNDLYCVGAQDISGKIKVGVADKPSQAYSGLKSVKITKSNGEVTTVISDKTAEMEIDVSSWDDGIWTITVVAEDFCGNTETNSFTFKKDVTAPETGNIDLNADDQDVSKDIEALDGKDWFAPEIDVEAGKDGYISFRIGSKSAEEKLRKIIVKINNIEKTFTYNDGKGWYEEENGGSYVYASTQNWVKNGLQPNAPTDEIPYNHYVVEATLMDKHRNEVVLPTRIVYVDKVAPTIEKVTVRKADETLVDQIIRILSFGIFSNDDLIFSVYTYDGKGDSGMKSVDMTVTNKDTDEKELRTTTSGSVDDNGYTVYSFTVSKKDLVKFNASLAFTAYDRYGKDCTTYPYIDINENFEVMIERELPAINFPLPEATGFYEEREDDQIWYNADKPLSLQVTDTHSGIYSITLLVNGHKEELFSDPQGIVKYQLFATVKEEGAETSRFDQYFTLYNLEKAVNSNAVPGKNGEYRIAIKVVDNSGNIHAEEAVYYIDTVKPAIDKITFSTPTADDVEEIAGDGILSADAPVVYSYFFQKDFDITLHVSDQGPSSGLHHVDYWFNNTNGEAKTAEIRDGKALIDVPENFKGMVYYRVWDMAGNCSEVMTTNAFVVDAEAPAIEIKYDAVTTDYKDAAGNPLYTQTKTFTVTITDLVSGLNQFGYVKNAELHKVEHIGDTVAKDDPHKVGDILPGGWRIEKMDANLVTVVTQTFSFAEDDNDIQMFFNAMDQAENKKENVASAVFTIDKTAPKILVDFGSDNDDDVYYNQNRIATITVTERNFNEGLIRVMIENRYGNVPGYTFRHDDNTKHTATINFDEGDYTFDLTGKDLGGHEAEVTFAGGNEKLFYVDKTVPFISENFYEFANAQENSFNTDKTATITIVEHNFDPNLTNLRITRKAAGGEHSHNGMVDVTNEILRGNKWNKNVDTYTISFTFSEDAVYYVEIAPVDLASNHGAKHNTVVFEIDKTVPVVSAKNGQAVAPDATELLDIYPYDRRNDPAPTVDFADNNIASIEYTLITYIPKYMGNGLTVVEPVVERGTIQGSRFTLENFEEDGIYSVELVAVDVAGNRSEINYNTYARMVNQDVLAFILDSNVKDQTGLFSLEYEDGEAISKKPDGFMDLRILVMTPADTPIEIVLRDTNGKETLTTAGLISLESVYGVNVHTFALPADFFRENFQDDIDTEMHLTVRNQGGRIDLARIHIDSIKPTCDVPEELCKWAWFFGEEDRTFTITNISEKLEEADCRVYDNGEMIPFVYSAEEDTLTFTLSKGWHNIGFILSDAAGNANIGQEVGNIHIGYFWCYFIAAGFTALVAVAAALYLYRRRQILQEMMDEA